MPRILHAGLVHVVSETCCPPPTHTGIRVVGRAPLEDTWWQSTAWDADRGLSDADQVVSLSILSNAHAYTCAQTWHWQIKSSSTRPKQNTLPNPVKHVRRCAGAATRGRNTSIGKKTRVKRRRAACLSQGVAGVSRYGVKTGSHPLECVCK